MTMNLIKNRIKTDDYYQYCQRGALNHAKLKYSSSYLYNFDIDEILVYNKKEILDNLKLYDCLKFVSYDVLVLNENLSSEYSFSLFKYRTKKEFNQAQKYIINCKKVGYMNVHSVLTKNKLEIRSSKGYFLHYMGITTNWKYDRLTPSNIKEYKKIDLKF